jgi:hypothetical protein
MTTTKGNTKITSPTELNKPRVKDIGARLPLDLYDELIAHLQKINESRLGKVTVKEYAIYSIREQIKRDKEEAKSGS